MKEKKRGTKRCKRKAHHLLQRTMDPHSSVRLQYKNKRIFWSAVPQLWEQRPREFNSINTDLFNLSKINWHAQPRLFEALSLSATTTTSLRAVEPSLPRFSDDTSYSLLCQGKPGLTDLFLFGLRRRLIKTPQARNIRELSATDGQWRNLHDRRSCGSR